MAKPRVTATDRLQNVIEAVDLGRRTGLLAVERGSGPVREEGEIYFMNGRPIYAAMAALRGREALAVLTRWGECRFAFDPNAPRPTPNVSGVLPSLDMVDHAHGTRPSLPQSAPTGPFPLPTGPLAPPTGPFGAPAGSSSGTSNGSWSFNRGFSGLNPPSHAPNSTPLGYPYDANSNLIYGQNPLLMRRPRRAPDVRDLMTIVATYNLSRGHRTILLLADGEHTILDLARLSSKSTDEVSQLLAELESNGLVYYYS